MGVYHVTRHFTKNPGSSISWITIADNADQAIKELDLKRYGRKLVKVREATVEEIQDYIKSLEKIEVYTEKDSLITPLMIASCQIELELREEVSV
jgi:hypothetical protein